VGPVGLRSAIAAGLVGAFASLYLALVGLTERFGDLELIGEQVTLGRVLLVVPPLVAGYVVTRPRVVAGERRIPTRVEAAFAGASTGAIAGAVFGAAVAFAEWFDVNRIREVFITVSPGLIEFVTFERGVAAGFVILVVIGVLGGAVGGALRASSPLVRTPIVLGASVAILLGLLQRIIPVAMRQLDLEPSVLYEVSGGLTIPAGVGVIAVTAGANVLWTRSGPRVRDRIRTSAREQPVARTAVLIVVLAVAAILPLLVGSVISEVLGTVMVFMLLGLGLNIVVGYAGLLDLGYVAFFAFGAYALALVTGATLNTTTGAAEPAFALGLNFYIGVWVVAALAAGVGLLIGAPVLRLRGDYLAIAIG
jgi:branched-chain amino acid transport system permease protein